MTSKEALEKITSYVFIIGETTPYSCLGGIFPEEVEEIKKDLEKLEKIRKTFKVEKEETINQNLYWLYIGERPILITRKIYNLVKDELEDGNNEKKERI